MQLLKIEGNSSILGLEYVKDRDIVVASTMDRAIRFYSVKDRKELFSFVNAHKDWIFHIQLIN